jgi:hypothetical protein
VAPGADRASPGVVGPDPAEVVRLADARARVLDRIAGACARAGRDPAEVTLVAVSKTVPAERLVAAVAAGLDTLGENRVQEAAAKRPLVDGARWHLVGPLQSNKARRALELFEVVETVDSIGLAARLDGLLRSGDASGAGGSAATLTRSTGPRPILLQVNVDRDPAKAGLDPADLPEAIEAIAALGSLDVAGLMTIGRLTDDPEAARPTFVALRALADRLRAGHPALGPALSMGMSDDYPVAVEEGATIVRVGRALFGERSR